MNIPEYIGFSTHLIQNSNKKSNQLELKNKLWSLKVKKILYTLETH